MPDDIDLKFTTSAGASGEGQFTDLAGLGDLDPALISGGITILVVDTSVDDYETLIADLAPGTQVVLIDGETGGLADVAAALEGWQNVGSIQIVSHGDVGQLRVGQDVLTADNISDYADTLEAIGQALAADGDLLLYGCRIGQSGEGADFISAVSGLTGADVAASDDVTGAAQNGGDWDLEIRTGSIEADVPFSEAAMADFSEVLAIPGTINFSTVGVAGSYLQGANTIDATVTDSGYTLVLDGTTHSTGAAFGRVYTSAGESLLTLSFQGGYVFTATSIYIFNISGTSDNFTVKSDKGDTTTTGSLLDSTGTAVNLSGFSSGLTKLYVYAADNSGYFSVDDLAITAISAPNNAPTISSAPTDVTVTEDTASNVDLSAAVVADIDGDSITLTLSVDAGTFSTPADGAAGGVTETLVNSTTITLVGTAANINTYLDTASNIQYTGASNVNGNDAATLTITPNDGTTDGTAATVNLDITAVNDAPVLDNTQSPTLTAISEDAGDDDGSGADGDDDATNNANNGGTTVATVVVDSSITDADGSATESIAVTVVDNTNGLWQYSTDSGTSWNNFTGVTGTSVDIETSARLLGATDMVRFVPDANYNGSATFTFRAWDQTSGAAGGTADASTNGTSTAFSTASDTAAVTVNAVNDDPTISGLVTDLAFTEDTAGNVNLSASAIADVDSASVTLTITASEGTFSTPADGAGVGAGVTETLVNATTITLGGSPTDINTYLDTGASIQWTPVADDNGDNTSTFTITANDGDGSGDVALGTVNADVTAVNDAPVLDNTQSPALTGISEDAGDDDGSGADGDDDATNNSNNGGDTVANIVVNSSITDADGSATESIAVTVVDNTNGLWQYSTDSGSTWTNFTGVTGTSVDISSAARLLDTTDMVRFVPGADYQGSATFTFRAWDQTSGSAGGTADTSTSGGTSAFSSATDTASVTVTGVNDAPVFTGLDGTPSYTEGGTVVTLDANVTVADQELDSLSDFAGATLTIARNGGADATDDYGFDTSGASFTVSGSNLQSGGLTFASFSEVGGTLTISFSSAATAATGALVDDVLQRITYQTTSDDPSSSVQLDWTFSDGNSANAQGTGDNPGTVTGSTTVSITATNDDPSATGLPTTLTVTEDTSSGLDLSGISFSDPDIGSGDVTVTLEVDAGTIALANPAVNSLTGTGNGTGTITLTGTIANIEAYLNTPTNTSYTSASNANGTAAATLTVKINDNGNTGTGGGTDVTLGTVDIDITAVNDAPTMTAPSSAASFTEGGSAVVIDSAITVADIDSTTLATATVSITGNFQSGNDTLAFTNTSGMGNIAGSYNAGTGVLTLSSAGATATLAEWQAALRAVTYTNDSADPAASGGADRTISFVLNDGTDDSSTVTQTVDITVINSEPSMSATGTDPSFTEGGSAADLFSTVTASTTDSSQTFTSLTLTVTNVTDTGAEILTADGTAITLDDAESGTTTTNSLGYSVSVSGTTATVTFTGGTMSAAALQTMVDGLAYSNTSDNPTTGSNRVVTITSLTDSGGTTNGGDDTVALAISSTVSLTAVNDAPVIGNLNGDSASEVVAGSGAQDVTDLNDVTVTNVDSADYNGGSLVITQGSGTANGSWGVDGSTATAGGDGTIAAGETISVGGSAIGTVHATNDGQGGNTLQIDFDTADATSANIQTLMRALTYSGPSGLGARVFTVTLNDGDGTANGGDQDTAATFTLTLTPNPPVIGNVDGDSLTFTEGDSATLLDVSSNGTVTDADSANFNGGNLTVSYQSGQQAEDRIEIDTSGTVTLSAGMTAGSIVSVGGTAIGTIGSGATGGASEDLTITLNSNATPTRVQDLVRALQYNNAGGDNPTDGDRVIRISVTDAASNSATGTADITVNVNPVNDAPTASLPTDVTVTEDTASDVNLSAVDLTDADSASITVTLAANAGTFSAPADGAGVGGGVTETLVNSTTITLAGAPDDIDTYLDTASNLQYTGALNAAGNDAATITVTANDGDGSGNVSLGTVNIDITGVNDLPTSSGGSVSGTKGKTVTFTTSSFNFADVDSGDSLNSVRIDTLPTAGTLRLSGVAVTAGQVITAANIANLTYSNSAAGSFSFTYSVNDGTGYATSTANMAITLATGNNAPTAPTLSASTVTENAKGAVIGALSSTDPEGTAVTFGVSDTRFEVVGGSLKLKDGISLDYETETSVLITVTATDGTGLSHVRDFTITVRDVSEITGGGGNDTLTGGNEDDFVLSGGGNDHVNGGGGKDTIDGGDGNDDVNGGDDDDLLRGGGGNDTVRGGSGNDLVYAGANDDGDDTVDGNDGDDSLGGGRGDDYIVGGDGNDVLWGRVGNDTLDGGADNDVIYNGTGDDIVFGGTGNDTIWAGYDDDTLSGGSGADTFVFGAHVGNDVITDFDVAQDVLQLTHSSAGLDTLADVQAAASNATQNGQAGLLIELQGSDTVFLIGLSVDDLASMNLVF